MVATSWAVVLAALAGGIQVAPAAQDPTGHWRERLAALARRDGRHGTFGPTGDRLWGSRVEPAPGFRGQFHYVQHTPQLRDPLTLELTDGRGGVLPVTVVEQEWQPSHSTVRYRVGDGELLERRWITADDVLVAQLAVRGLRRFGVRWRSPFAHEPVGDLARFEPVALSGTANVDLMRSPLLRSGDPRAPVVFEAEDADRQVGASGEDHRAAASGGQVLGGDFGSAKGHEAGYSFLGTGVGEWTLVARYARALPGEGVFTVALNGVEVGELRCGPTGGWGDAESHFRLQRLLLGAIADASTELTITAAADGATTCFDALLLVPADAAEAPLPDRARWPECDPLRGAIRLPGGQLVVDGVPFSFLPPMGPQGVDRTDEPVTVRGAGGRLHVLAVPTGADAAVACGELRRPLGRRRRSLAAHVVSLEVATAGDLALRLHQCVLLAATREVVPAGGTAHVRRGRVAWHGIPTEVRAGVFGLPQPWRVESDGRAVEFHAAFELAGDRLPGAATARALASDDPAAAHVAEYAGWFAAHAPRLFSAEPFWERLWTYRWFLLRHNLARPERGNLRGGPVFYEGRHGAWLPRVLAFSTPHIVAESRWLTDPRFWLGNVRAHVQAQEPSGVLPNVGAGWRGFRCFHWIPHAVVEAFKVHPDRTAIEQLLPALLRNVRGTVAAFDRDGDGLLSVADPYTTGMEFQPSFWALQGYDNSQPPTELERPDTNAYLFGSARGLAEVCRSLGRDADAAAMLALAERTRAAVLQKQWHADDGFFYAIREADDVPARCREVVGFYPFRFGLVPDEARYAEAWRALLDPAEFWTPFPGATCSRSVPVFAATPSHWPGPGGQVAPRMWNGPIWPHASSLVADAMAMAIRHSGQRVVGAAELGQFVRQLGMLHCEGGDPNKLLLREQADAETGVGRGCADALQGTFLDLLIRHAAGLVPRFDDVLEVRPLALGLGDLTFEDIPYRGHRVAIRIRGDRLWVAVDGEVLGEGAVREGLHLAGFLR